MIVAFAGLMSEGVIHYRLSTSTLERARISHGVIFALVTLLALLGLIIILVNKANIKHELYPHTAHALCGTVTLVLLLYQATSGVSKLRWFWKTETKIYKSHGKLGIFVIYLLGMITMLLGLYKVEQGASFWVAAISLVVLGGLVLHTFLRRKRTVIDTKYAHIAADELDGLEDIDAMDFS